jgi:hypothetical protein
MPDVDSEAHEAHGDFYTVEEAAKVLGRTPGRIRQLLRDGTLKGEGGGDPKDPWRVHKWSVHATRGEGPRRAPGRRRSDPASGPPAPGELQGEHRSDPTQETSGGITEARELHAKVAESLQRELGRLEGRLELTEVAESTLRESLARERERADAAETEARITPMQSPGKFGKT